MQGLITDRTQYNVSRRNALSAKGLRGMNADELKEWLGDPLAENGVNLLPCGPFYSGAVDLKYRNQKIVATAIWDGVYLYAISIIGAAENYENKTFTLSVNSIQASAGTPQLSLYWHDDNGYEYAGANVVGDSRIATVNTADFPNINKRANLALYVYVTTSETVTAGAEAVFNGVMFENGSVRHNYTPYTEILPTAATKGAYNYSDLNRVERAVAEISDLAGLSLVTKTDWAMWDIPTDDDMSRYLNNIRAIRAIIPNASTVPAVPATMNNLTYSVANDIEKILLAAYVAVGG